MGSRGPWRRAKTDAQGSVKMKFIDYFDRISIIHLPERTDRYQALERELKSIDIKHPKVRIPFAPRPDDAYGFTSKGVYGSFLILQRQVYSCRRHNLL